MLDSGIKVLCFTDEAAVKGLKWAFDQKVYSERKYDFYLGSLGRVPENLADFGMYAMTLDLGQPLPLENLKKLPPKPGVCAFLQPTPQQLVSLGELPDWNALAWDGVSFERLAARLDILGSRLESAARSGNFVESCGLWVRAQMSSPGSIDWSNPPATWNGPKSFRLDPQTRQFTIGGQDSKADLKLPVPGLGEACELRYHNGVWNLRISRQSEGVSFIGNQDELLPGDQLEVHGFYLQIKMHPEAEDFLGLAKRSGLFKDLVPTRESSPDRTLAEVCREFLSAWTTGELRVSAGLKHGSIYFIDGNIYHAVSGAVGGVKAILRMLGWPDPVWRFNADRKSELTQKRLSIGFAEFSELHRGWKEKWAKVQSLYPPPQVRLKASAKIFNRNEDWTTHDYQVLAAVCEYQLVRDIFNNCALTDVEILSSLVDMRRRGLVEPLVSPRT